MAMTVQVKSNYADIVTAGAISGAQKFFCVDANGYITILFAWDGAGQVLYLYSVTEPGIPATDAWMTGAVIAGANLQLGEG